MVKITVPQNSKQNKRTKELSWYQTYTPAYKHISLNNYYHILIANINLISTKSGLLYSVSKLAVAHVSFHYYLIYAFGLK